MFSKELAKLDRNTVQLMIDEMQDEINAQKEEISTQKQQINSQQHQIHKMILLLSQSVSDAAQIASQTGVPLEEVQAVLEGTDKTDTEV